MEFLLISSNLGFLLIFLLFSTSAFVVSTKKAAKLSIKVSGKHFMYDIKIICKFYYKNKHLIDNFTNLNFLPHCF
jgi:hypothetical protein